MVHRLAPAYGWWALKVAQALDGKEPLRQLEINHRHPSGSVGKTMSTSSKASDTGGPCNSKETLRPAQDGIGFESFQLPDPKSCDWPLSRRTFVKGAGIAAGAAVLLPGFDSPESPAEEALSASEIPLSITVNGERKQLQVDVRTSLLDLLRENLGLTGTKKGCDHGQCGACTVLVGGRRINSCLALAISYDGEEITSIEGLADNDAMHPVQQAFLENDGYQCGYCTPGQILSAVALLDEAKKGAASVVTRDLHSNSIELSADEIRERMSGNICRCGAYPGIVAAVRQADGGKRESAKAEIRGDKNAAI